MTTSRLPPARLSRRGFLRIVVAGAGGVTAGLVWRTPAADARRAQPLAIEADLPGAYVTIRPDNSVVIRCSRPEMGQGTMTSIPLLITEELEADWDAVVVEWAPTRPPFTDPGFYGVEWSSSVRDMHLPMRRLGAGLKHLLVAAAAKRWAVPEGECEAWSTCVHRRGRVERLAYGELAPALVGLALPETPALKAPASYRLIGRWIPSRISRDVADGSARYGIDLAHAGAVTAVVARAPNRHATLVGSDEAAARRVPGVISVEAIAPGVAVVARDTWSAIRGREALAPRWTIGQDAAWDDERIRKRLREALDEPATFVPLDHLPASGPRYGATNVTAVYEVPYEAHAAIEPTSAIAECGPGGCTVWMATQNVAHLAKSVAAALGLPPASVTVHPALMGGSFGRKYEPDPAVEAALLSQRLRRPVRVVWTREDEMQRGPHRPAQTARLSVTLDESGLPGTIDASYAGPSYFIRKPDDLERVGTRDGGFDSSTLEGLVPFPYPVPYMRVRQSWVDFGISVGSWRSTSHSFGTFFIESLADELAHERREDPLDYRLRWLQTGRALPAEQVPKQAFNPPFDLARMERVIARLREHSSWNTRRRDGAGIGAAIQFAYEGYFAAAVEVRVQPAGYRVSRAWIIADVGQVVNRSGADQQLRGGFIFGLTAACRSALSIRGGTVEQTNFDGFPLLRMNATPDVSVEFVESSAPPGGLGEAGVPLAAPAVANALFAATGTRHRSLPIRVDTADA